AAEYKAATIKGIGKGGIVLLQVEDREVKLAPVSSMKAYDADGKLLDDGKNIATFGHAFRVIKAGNVVDVKSEMKGKLEVIREIHLRQGELTAAAKPVEKRSSGKTEGHHYERAVVKKFEKYVLFLDFEDGEVRVGTNNSTKAEDADGKQLKKGEYVRLLKKGNVLDVKTRKIADKEWAVEIKLVDGDLKSEEEVGGKDGKADARERMNGAKEK